MNDIGEWKREMVRKKRPVKSQEGETKASVKGSKIDRVKWFSCKIQVESEVVNTQRGVKEEEKSSVKTKGSIEKASHGHSRDPL